MTNPATARGEDCCPTPLFVLFVSAAVWLVISSCLALAASLTFHAPDLFADHGWLSYGRTFNAFKDAFLYGFCIQGGIGLALWCFSRTGETPIAHEPVAALGAALWNFGVTLGIIGILIGDSTGFDAMQMPRYAATLLFISYVLLGITAAVTLRRRVPGKFDVPHWFFITAIFWFPWIYSSAYLLLVIAPVRGVTQAVIGWWYANNLEFIWLSLAGLGALFCLTPHLAKRGLHSAYLAALAFWILILFGSWGGIPNHAPVPAWLPALSTVGTVLTVVAAIAVVLNLRATFKNSSCGTLPPEGKAALRFLRFGAAAFFIFVFVNAAMSVLQVSQWTEFTSLVAAKTRLQLYGFFAMVLFGAVYYLAPRLVAMDFWLKGLIKLHFILAALGILLTVFPLGIGGVVQGLQMHNGSTPFLEIMKTMLHFTRVSTIGDALFLAGSVVFAANLIRGASRYYQAQALAAYNLATEDLFKAEAKR